MSSIFYFLRSRVGLFLGLVQSYIGQTFYNYDSSILDTRRRCCSQLSLGLEIFDGRSSNSIKRAMRLNGDDAPELGHNGERYKRHAFEGIWWMDGNPALEILVSAADAYYLSKDEFKDSRRLFFPTLDVEGGTWAYEDSVGGRALFINQCTNDVRPRFVIDDNESRFLAQGDPDNDDDAMTYIDDDTYTKPIIYGLKEYTLRRIIDADGRETANWDVWQKHVKWLKRRQSLVIYRRRGREDETCHYDRSTLNYFTYGDDF